MARLLRVQFPGAIYHVSTRGNERRLLFRDDADRARFLAQLADSKELYSLRLFLVCLMPNHFHLLLATPGAI
jgi:putative transposase